MDLYTFYKTYNLCEIEVIKIYNKDDDLCMLLNLEASLELIANGCRPTFDLFYKHLFIFKNSRIKINLKNPIITSYEYKNDKIYLKANNKEIIIDSKDIEIKENCEG